MAKRRHKTDRAVQPALLDAEFFPEYTEKVYAPSRVMLGSDSEHWCSPDPLLLLVREFAGGQIAFDPFSNPYSRVDAAQAWGLPDVNSLLCDWPLDGTHYYNPPFGAAIQNCAEKIYQQSRRGIESITCAPARMDTEWWQDGLRSPLWCAWRGRLKFYELITALEARYLETLRKAISAGQEPPAKPKYKIINEHLAEGDPAPFAVVLAYHGKRRERFANVFESKGRIYTDLARLKEDLP